MMRHPERTLYNPSLLFTLRVFNAYVGEARQPLVDPFMSHW